MHIFTRKSEKIKNKIQIFIEKDKIKKDKRLQKIYENEIHIFTQKD